MQFAMELCITLSSADALMLGAILHEQELADAELVDEFQREFHNDAQAVSDARDRAFLIQRMRASMGLLPIA